MRPPVRSIYIHSPFCARRCPYCDFAIALPGGRVSPRRYLRNLETEIATRCEGLAPRTVFVGGGTPTSLTPEELREFFDCLGRHLDLTGVVEFSVEANPEDLDTDRIGILAEHGVSRVSLGVQSLDPERLITLGRQHTRDQVARGLARLRHADIRNINTDLIFGIPGQTLDDLEQDVAGLLELHPDHVSAYSLTFEDDTPMTAALKSGKLTRLSEEEDLAHFRLVRTRLAEGGLPPYEISNFARPGKRCLHNLGYWRNQDHLGVGPSAVSYLKGTRSKNDPSLGGWCARVEAGESTFIDEERLSQDRSLKETVMVGLRTTVGVGQGRLQRRYGCGLEILDQRAIQALKEQGLISTDSNRLKLTPRGLEVADEVCASLL